MKFLYLFFLPFLSCCKGMEIKRSLQQLHSKKIEIPTDLRTTYNGKDTIMNDIFESELKFIIYSDSTSCTSCNIGKIYLWELILKYTKKFNGGVRIYFIFNPSNENSIAITITALLSNPINYPVLIDKYGSFRKLNPHLPKNKTMHTFLLDKNNNVILVGNPLHNKEIEKLFYKKTQELLAK